MRTREHKRTWSRSRGAALAEVTVLAPILILMWIGIDYFRSGYARRLAVLSDVQHRAWKRSFARDGSCLAGVTADTRVMKKLLGGVDADILDAAVDQYAGTRPAWQLKAGHFELESTMDAHEARWGGGERAKVTAGAFLPCNEVVGDDRDVQPTVGGLLWDRFQ